MTTPTPPLAPPTNDTTSHSEDDNGKGFIARHWKGIGVAVVVLLLIAVFNQPDDSTSPVAVPTVGEVSEAPVPTPEATSTPTLVPTPTAVPESDPVSPLDALAEQCESGDMDACEDLYMDSEIGSDHKALAASELGWFTPDDLGLEDDDDLALDEFDDEMVVQITEVSLNSAWGSLTTTERDDLCLGWRVNPEALFEIFKASTEGDGWDEDTAREFFDGKCF